VEQQPETKNNLEVVTECPLCWKKLGETSRGMEHVESCGRALKLPPKRLKEALQFHLHQRQATEWETFGLECPPTLIERPGVRGKVKFQQAVPPAEPAPIPNVENQSGFRVEDAWDDDLFFATFDMDAFYHTASQLVPAPKLTTTTGPRSRSRSLASLASSSDESSTAEAYRSAMPKYRRMGPEALKVTNVFFFKSVRHSWVLIGFHFDLCLLCSVQKQLRKYGLKPSFQRSTAISLLSHIYRETHRDE